MSGVRCRGCAMPRCRTEKPQEKRPVYIAKEAYFYSKRGLFLKQKRPIDVATCRTETLQRRTPPFTFRENFFFPRSVMNSAIRHCRDGDRRTTGCAQRYYTRGLFYSKRGLFFDILEAKEA